MFDISHRLKARRVRGECQWLVGWNLMRLVIEAFPNRTVDAARSVSSRWEQIDDQHMNLVQQRRLDFVHKFLDVSQPILVGGRNNFQQRDDVMPADMSNRQGSP